MSEQLIFEVGANKVATITLNRPEKLNAFTQEMKDDWVAALEECRTSDKVNVIVITGRGRAFCTGGDLGKFTDYSHEPPAAVRERIFDAQRIAVKLGELDKPVIAAINGVATGGGLDVALGCDIRVAAQSARFAETYNKMGMIPGAGGAYYLPRVIGLSRALKMLWTADFMETEEALRIGLIDEVHPDAELMDKAMALAERIAAQPSLAVRLTKTIACQGLAMDLRSALNLAASTMPIVRTSDDHREAVAAFREKRKPNFTGR